MYHFINPYNFVPFGSGELKKEDKKTIYRGKEWQKELLSGWLEIDLMIKTPLIIPDGAHPKYCDPKKVPDPKNAQIANKAHPKYCDPKNPDRIIEGVGSENTKKIHKSYDFFKARNPDNEEMEYCIPGSSLRGLIRSVYETVTNSCVPFLMDDKPMSQRVPLYSAMTERGLLGYNNGSWVLYKTEKSKTEVIVVPVFAANGKYYVESLARVRNVEENKKYSIYEAIDTIEKALRTMKHNKKTLHCDAIFKKNHDKWDIIVNNNTVAAKIDKKVVRYLFLREDGSEVKEETATYIEGKGWLQYNVPVDVNRVYHIAHLEKMKPDSKTLEEYRWAKSSPRGNANEEKKNNESAAAYKKLKSALYRDGVLGGVQNPNEDCNRALKEALEKACEDPEQLVPVYYFKVKHGEDVFVYMSGSAAGRIAQRRRWKEIMGGHLPCEDKLCPACLLFGTTKGGGMKGHLRFSDAFLKKGAREIKSRKHTLQILASPRVTAFEFYLKKPVTEAERQVPGGKAVYWNFDFCGVKEKDASGKYKKTVYMHLEKALLRGRKMYWHHALSEDSKKKDWKNNTMECLENGCFHFKLFFDGITKQQLNDLIWVITLGENDENGNFQHKLGHAKPLGYGSVKMSVKEGKIRHFTGNDSYRYQIRKMQDAGISPDDPKTSFDRESEIVKNLLKICDASSVGDMIVDYPRRVKNGRIFDWFSDNRTNPMRLAVLPDIGDADISLKSNITDEKHGSSDGLGEE